MTCLLFNKFDNSFEKGKFCRFLLSKMNESIGSSIILIQNIVLETSH